MKKLALYLSVSVIVFTCFSCKKSDSNDNKDAKPSFYIKLKIDGAQKQMDYHVTSLINFSTPIYMCQLAGQFTGNTTAGVSIVLNDGAAYVVNKEYKQQIITVGSTATIQCAVTFKDADNSLYGGNIADNKTNMVLKFTEIADDHLKGLFSGTFVKVDGKSPATYVNITDGEFNVGRSL